MSYIRGTVVDGFVRGTPSPPHSGALTSPATPSELVLLAMLEDFLFPREVLIVDECPDFEMQEHLEFFHRVIIERARRKSLTLIVRHLPLSTLPPGVASQILLAERLMVP
jgi:hypothetical protein